MAKRERKSIADLIDKKPSATMEDIDRAVEQIHTPIMQPKATLNKKVKTTRVTVDTPENLHKALKKITIDEGTDLKSFYLLAVKEKCERLGYKLPEE